MTDQELNDRIAFDTERWTRDGIAADLINTRNASTRRYFRMNESPFAQAAARLQSKIKGTAPGTPINAEPLVIDGTPPAAPLTTPTDVCPTCKNFEWITGNDGNLRPCPTCGAAERIAARKVASVDAHSSANGRAADQTFDNFVFSDRLSIREKLSLQQCFEAVKAWADNPDGWIVMHGPPGNGKSHMAAAAYNKLKTRSKPTIFITVPEMLESLIKLFNHATANIEDTTYDERLSTFKTVPVLIMDDLGAHHDGKGWAQSVLFTILDYRYRNQLPTLITMNITPDDPRLGERISDRLQDTHDGFSRVYNNTAPTHRRA